MGTPIRTVRHVTFQSCRGRDLSHHSEIPVLVLWRIPFSGAEAWTEIIGTWLTQADDEQELPLARCSWRTSVPCTPTVVYYVMFFYRTKYICSSFSRRQVKEKWWNIWHSKFAWYILGVFARKVIMTETFGFLPDKRPVNYWYIFDVYYQVREGRYSHTESWQVSIPYCPISLCRSYRM
jgi:hypothetical protein